MRQWEYLTNSFGSDRQLLNARILVLPKIRSITSRGVFSKTMIYDNGKKHLLLLQIFHKFYLFLINSIT